MAHLRIEIVGEQFLADLPSAVVRIGRDSDCDLRIDDAGVGAFHAAVEPLAAGGHLLRDENTGRGTKVNGMGVKRVVLRDGDVIEIGRARITYLAAAAPVFAAPDPSAAPPPPLEVPEAIPAARPVPQAGAGPVPAGGPASVRVAAAPRPVEPGVAAVVVERSPDSVRARGSSKRKLFAAVIALALFAGLATLGAQLLYSARDSTGGVARRKHDLDRADDLAATDLDAALALYDSLTTCEVAGVRAKAKQEADYWRQRLKTAEADYADLLARAPSLDAAQAKAAVESLSLKHGEMLAKRQGDVLSKVAKARDAWVAARAAEASSEAESWMDSGKFAAAVQAWDAFEKEAPAVEPARVALEAGRASVAERSANAFRDLLAAAEDRMKAQGPGAAAMLLRERLADFAGTPTGAALARRAADYAERSASIVERGAPAATPAATGSSGANPAALPTARPTDPAGYQAALAKVEAALLARKIGDAVAAGGDVVRAAGTGPLASEAQTLVEDLDLARQGMEAIGRAIREHPDRFVSFEISSKFTVRIVDADAEFLTALVPGGQAKHRWSALDPSRFAILVDLARFPGKELLAPAELLALVGAKEAAERALFRHVEDGGDAAAAYARIARWRHERPPAGGYVAYEGRFVSPAERERLVLEARIAQAAARVSAKDAPTRKAAGDELMSLGAAGKEALAKAMRARRNAIVSELTGLKVWTSAKTRAKLQQELEKRRKEAIALIENATAYPYPSATHQGQEEVNRLVDRVREVWERPFDVVAAGEKSAQDLLALVAEADLALAQAEEGYVPDLDGLKAKVNQAIDVPGISPEPYSRDVLAYDERVATSAGREEKDNVRAVNEYRIMMGRWAVKINERLVRAARGHSIEMRTKGYFAHESPTPGLESPGKRVAREGYAGGVGENIAMGTLTGRNAFDAWFHSSGHHRNMLNRGWTEMGAGRSGGTYWTQNFGGMTGKNLKDPEALPPPRADVAPEPDDVANPAVPGRPNVPDEPPPTAPPDEPPPDGGTPPDGPPAGMDGGTAPGMDGGAPGMAPGG